ncbi:hypothetical protein D3C85_1552460 [compost metagenome]
MLARHAARGKTEARGDIGQARRLAVVGDALTDELEDGAAFWGKIVHGAHLYSFRSTLNSPLRRQLWL